MHNPKLKILGCDNHTHKRAVSHYSCFIGVYDFPSLDNGGRWNCRLARSDSEVLRLERLLREIEGKRESRVITKGFIGTWWVL